MDLPSEENPTPAPSRWQFSLRQMFAATTAVAILFGVAASGGWVQSDAVVYLAMAILTGVFWRAARHALIGAGMIVGAFCLAEWVAESISPSAAMFHPWVVWIFPPLVFSSAAFLRACTRATIWSLIGSLVLIELFIVAGIIHRSGCPTLFQALTAKYREDVFNDCLDYFPGQRWYIAAPWLFGIVVGEIIARRRKPSGDEPQRV